MDRTVVFEQINEHFRWAIAWYRLQGARILFIRMNARMKEKKWVQQLLSNGAIAKIDFNPRLAFFDGVDEDTAFDYVDQIYPYFDHENPILKAGKDLYQDPHVDLRR